MSIRLKISAKAENEIFISLPKKKLQKLRLFSFPLRFSYRKEYNSFMFSVDFWLLKMNFFVCNMSWRGALSDIMTFCLSQRLLPLNLQI